MAQISNSKKFGFFCHKCKRDNEDRMINCFACDANFHAKCIGLNGNMADKINADSGFHYYCESHKNISVKTVLYKLSCFQKLNQQLKTLLDEFTSLSNYNADELLKNLETRQSSNDDVFSNFTSFEKRPTRSDSNNNHNKKELKRKTNNESGIPPKIAKEQQSSNLTPVNHQNINGAPTPSSSELSMNNVIDETFISSVTMNVALQNSSTENHTPLPTQNGKLRIAQKPPKLKSIYVSRLDINTDENEVKTYLSNVAGPDIVKDLKIFKLNSSRNKYFSSFKIICHEAVFEMITRFFIDDGAIAREFVYNTVNISNQTQNQASKN